jgi:hypothetical protein
LGFRFPIPIAESIMLETVPLPSSRLLHRVHASLDSGANDFVGRKATADDSRPFATLKFTFLPFAHLHIG